MRYQVGNPALAPGSPPRSPWAHPQPHVPAPPFLGKKRSQAPKKKKKQKKKKSQKKSPPRLYLYSAAPRSDERNCVGEYARGLGKRGITAATMTYHDVDKFLDEQVQKLNTHLLPSPSWTSLHSNAKMNYTPTLASITRTAAPCRS